LLDPLGANLRTCGPADPKFFSGTSAVSGCVAPSPHHPYRSTFSARLLRLGLGRVHPVGILRDFFRDAEQQQQRQSHRRCCRRCSRTALPPVHQPSSAAPAILQPLAPSETRITIDAHTSPRSAIVKLKCLSAVTTQRVALSQSLDAILRITELDALDFLGLHTRSAVPGRATRPRLALVLNQCVASATLKRLHGSSLSL
jgi:hypothetical protein